jgi:hypothetical protein
LALLRRAEREFATTDFDLNDPSPEGLPFFREPLSPTMATIRSTLALDTPSLSASSAGVFSAKSICTFLGTVLLH